MNIEDEVRRLRDEVRSALCLHGLKRAHKVKVKWLEIHSCQEGAGKGRKRQTKGSGEVRARELEGCRREGSAKEVSTVALHAALPDDGEVQGTEGQKRKRDGIGAGVDGGTESPAKRGKKIELIVIDDGDDAEEVGGMNWGAELAHLLQTLQRKARDEGDKGAQEALEDALGHLRETYTHIRSQVKSHLNPQSVAPVTPHSAGGALCGVLPPLMANTGLSEVGAPSSGGD